jgi:hypothetical protein
MTGPTDPGQGDDGHPITVAKISLISASVVALIGAAATVTTAMIKHQSGETAATPPAATGSQDRTSTGQTAPGTAQVEFYSPRPGTQIHPGAKLSLSGYVQGLGGNQLWIMSRHGNDPSYYLVAKAGPVGNLPAATRDGRWAVDDVHAGNSTDLNSQFTYYALEANADCTRTLSSMNSYHTLDDLPNGCTRLTDVSVQVV